MPRTWSDEIRWLTELIRPHLRWQAAGALGITSGSLLNFADPLLLRWIIDVAVPARDAWGIGLGAGACLLIMTLRSGLIALGGRYSFRASQLLQSDLRRRVLRQFERLSTDYHEATPAGKREHLLREGLDEVTRLAGDLTPVILRLVVQVGAAIAAMLYMNGWLALILVSALPPFFAVNYYFRGRMKRAGEAAQERTLSWASRVSEHIAGLPQLIALGQQRHRTRLCFSANAEAIRGEARRKTAETEYVQASTFVATIALSALILFGGLQVLNGSLTIGGLVAFYSLQSRLIDPLYAASDLYARVQRGSLAVRNMMGFLRLEPTVADPPSAPPLISRWKGAIRIENVSLRYDNGRLALDQVDLRLNEGEHIALTGANGAGKSTLSKLIARLCDPTAGTVVLDDVPLTQILLRDVRRLIRYVPQHVMLWNGSIEENVRLGHPSASRPELDWAASLSGLDPVLMRSPKGWRENVGPGGSRLSGGERQRVVLARSILARPRVLLLDEATAAMDTSAEQEILRELDAALHDTTCVLISHRLSSIPKELPLIVMGDGRILPSSAYTQPYGENSSARANV